MTAFAQDNVDAVIPGGLWINIDAIAPTFVSLLPENCKLQHLAGLSEYGKCISVRYIADVDAINLQNTRLGEELL